MALPEDRETRLRCYRNALRNWRYQGYVAFKLRVAEWLAKELPTHRFVEIGRELHKHVDGGGEIEEQVEKRPEYVADEFHYDIRLTIGNRRLYFETVLRCEDADDPDDPVIEVVSVHDA